MHGVRLSFSIAVSFLSGKHFLSFATIHSDDVYTLLRSIGWCAVKRIYLVFTLILDILWSIDGIGRFGRFRLQA